MGSRSIRTISAMFLTLAWGAVNAQADPILWVNDSNGGLGRVDVSDGSVDLIGNTGVVLTDIAFAPNGDLYGISFTDLYRIDTTTAAATHIGSTGISDGNALVFGHDGTLYGAGNTSADLYQINISSGAATALGNIGFNSAGDLAFVDGKLYLSSTTNRLIHINLTGTVSGTDVGDIGFGNVFGLATPDNEALYGVSGTQVLLVDVANGAGTLVSDYGGQGLGIAYGSSFITEAVPEPSSMLLAGLGALTLLGWTRARGNGNALGCRASGKPQG